jgi:hypothetical protein
MDDKMRTRVEATERRIQASHERSIEHVKRAMETEETVIRQNKMLADTVPDRRDEHLARVSEGEAFLAALRNELEELEAGNLTADTE